MGPRNMLLTHLQKPASAGAGGCDKCVSGIAGARTDGTTIPCQACDGGAIHRVRLGSKAGGRPALQTRPDRRHVNMLVKAEGPTGVAGCELVKVSGTKASWPGGVPAAGDVLIAQGGERFGRWLKMRVVAVQWWDFGRTLEILVRVEADEARAGEHHKGTKGTERAGFQIPDSRSETPARAPALCALLCALCVFVASPLGGSTVADQKSGTYAHLPLEEMQRYLQRLSTFPDEVRRSALPEAGEAVLSEAQTESPRLTGFLSDSHVVLEDDTDQDGGSVVIGVNTTYAHAVHETHRTKKRWFLRAINEHFPRIMGKLLVRLAKEKGAR